MLHLSNKQRHNIGDDDFRLKTKEVCSQNEWTQGSAFQVQLEVETFRLDHSSQDNSTFTCRTTLCTAKKSSYWIGILKCFELDLNLLLY